MKKALSLILALLMMVVAIPITAVGVYAETTIPADAVEIGTKDQLLNMTWEEGKYYVLTDNIDLGGEVCTSAKIVLNNATLDGNGFSITGFSITGANGFISIAGTNATIKNVTFGKRGGEISLTSVGAWTAYAVLITQITPDQSCNMSDITLYANVNVTTDVAGCGGGFVGLCQGDIVMNNCVVYGTLYAKNNTKKPSITGFAAFVGCVGNEGVGDATGVFTNCYNYADVTAGARVGGFIGWDRLCFVEMSNCVNYGKIEANGTTEHNAGGMIGYVQNGINFSIENCANYGHVKATNNAGAMIGQGTFADNITISACANYGAVEGKGNVGVVIGYMQGKAEKTATISDILNVGSVTCTSGNRAALVIGSGQLGNTVINRAVNLGDISGKNTGGSIFGVWKNSEIAVYDSISANEGNNLYAVGFADNTTDTPATLTVSADKPNYYAVFTPAGNCDNGAIKLDSLEAVLEKLNNPTYTNVWGEFKASEVDDNGKATAIVLAIPILRGVQMGTNYVSDSGEALTSARFVGTIGNTLRYKELGYTITCNGKTLSKSTKYVYNTISASDNGGQQIEYTAAELGGKYAFALTLTDIPTKGTVALVVNAYAIDTNGTRYDDVKYSVIFTDGALVSMTLVDANA